MAVKAAPGEASADADAVTVIRDIAEHPLVIELRQQIDKLKLLLTDEVAVRQRAINALALEKVKYSTALLSLQDRYAKLLEWAVDARAAVNRPLPRD